MKGNLAMACNRTHPTPNVPAGPDTSHQDMHLELPCIDGLLVGTFALMTGYAEHQCDQGNARCRHLMAKKIVSNLLFLSSHPQMPKAMAAVMCNLKNHWHTLSALSALESKQGASDSPDAVKPHTASPPTAPALWHSAHPSVQ
jgi:hypothetical protein